MKHSPVVGLMMLVALACPGLARAAEQATQPEAIEGEYLRVSEQDDGVMALEIAITRFETDDPNVQRPPITMVGVAHIGDEAYYAALQEILDGHDLVLYESVMPDGVQESELHTDGQRVAHTNAAITFVWSQALAFKNVHGRWPQSLMELGDHAASRDSRVRGWIVNAADGWGRPLLYTCDDEGVQCSLTSYGADGTAGGDGVDADISSANPTIAADAAMYAAAPDDQLQSQLADALGLAFQLDSIDYSGASWVCSDMTMGQLTRAMAARGLDFGPIGSSLAGSSFSGQVVKVLLRLVRVADVMLDGAIADMFKVVMIEMLGDEQIMDQSMEQFGAGFGEVIIGERNRVVMDDLAPLIDAGGEQTIAVFYGAGHLADFEQRLRERFGYKPVAKQWQPAITVDLSTSAVPERQLRQLRVMIRQSMRQSMMMQRRRPVESDAASSNGDDDDQR